MSCPLLLLLLVVFDLHLFLYLFVVMNSLTGLFVHVALSHRCVLTNTNRRMERTKHANMLTQDLVQCRLRVSVTQQTQSFMTAGIPATDKDS